MSKKAEAREERKLDKETRQRKIGQLVSEPTIYDKRDFDSRKEAIEWMYQVLAGEEFFSGERFAYLDDPAMLREWDDIVYGECCGSAEYEIRVAGRPAKVGCNFGH